MGGLYETSTVTGFRFSIKDFQDLGLPKDGHSHSNFIVETKGGGQSDLPY